MPVKKRHVFVFSYTCNFVPKTNACLSFEEMTQKYGVRLLAVKSKGRNSVTTNKYWRFCKKQKPTLAKQNGNVICII